MLEEDNEIKPSNNTEMYLQRIARDIREVRNLLTASGNASKDAESEIPEKMRRFSMYMHDMRDILYMYHETGQPPPTYIMTEVERVSDRYKHLLDDLNNDGGAFEQVRRDMTQRGGNRYDHSKLLPKETKDETGNG